MKRSPQDEADRRFNEALEATGALDPRESYRGLLRQLKSRDEATYQEMVSRWKSEVIEPIQQGEAEPLQAWLRFGVGLASTLHPGRTVVVDEEGRSHTLEDLPDWRNLILHLPEDRGVRAIPISLPPDPTGAQSATVDLLVEGKLKLEKK